MPSALPQPVDGAVLGRDAGQVVVGAHGLARHALNQACLMKRPFNLFHRKNLYIRTANVERQFGNKTTWETPFPTLFTRLVKEANQKRGRLA